MATQVAAALAGLGVGYVAYTTASDAVWRRAEVTSRSLARIQDDMPNVYKSHILEVQTLCSLVANTHSCSPPSNLVLLLQVQRPGRFDEELKAARDAKVETVSAWNSAIRSASRAVVDNIQRRKAEETAAMEGRIQEALAASKAQDAQDAQDAGTSQ